MLTGISCQWRIFGLFFLVLSLLTAQSLGYIWFVLLTCVLIVFCVGIILAINDKISKDQKMEENVLYELRSPENESQTFTQGLSMVENSIQDRINTKQHEYNFLIHGGPRELTGVRQLDEVINKMIDSCIQDFIQGWYSKLNSDQAFLIETRILIERCIIAASQKVQAADWFVFLTRRIIQEVMTHIRLYKAAEQQMLAQSLRQNEKQDDNSQSLSLEDWFFKMEQEKTQDSFEAVCTSSTNAAEYHRLMVDIMMLFLMPEKEYDCVLLRDLLKEVLTMRVVGPALHFASKPSTINYIINSRSPSSTINARAFSKYLESSYIPTQDLVCVIAFFDKEIQELTRKGSSDREHSHLESLKGLRRYCKLRRKKLSDDSNKLELSNTTSFKGRAMLSLIYNVELSDNVLDFLSRSQETRREAQFLEDVLSFGDSYKFVDDSDGTSAQQSMRENATMIFSNYLTSSSDTYVQLDAKILENITKLLFSQSQINNDIFKDAIANVCHRLQELGSHQEFLNHCNTDGSKHGEDLIRSNQNLDHSTLVLKCTSIKCSVSNFSIESDTNLLSRSIVQYKLDIECTLENGEYYRWSLQKRYSDFDAFHKTIVENGIYLPPDLTLPQKFGIFTASTQVLAEARRKAIEAYLSRLLDLIRALPGLRDELAKFFSLHSTQNGPLTNKLSSGSSENVHNEVPETDSENDQLIKRILELMREIFDLKPEEDQSFYISLSSIILQSIIKTAKSDKLIRKLYDSYSEYTDPSFLATLLTMLTDSIWPQGIYRGNLPSLADPSRKVRNSRLGVVARIRLLNSLPEELVTFLTSKVTDKGMNRLYCMMQSRTLNKRFIYVIIESALEFILPNTVVKQELTQLRDKLSCEKHVL